VCAAVAIGIAQAQTATEHVIRSLGEFTKGANPNGSLIRDTAGNIDRALLHAYINVNMKAWLNAETARL
jgi:hypothetical protein